MTIRDLAHAIRGLVRRAVVRRSDDARATQLVDVSVGDGHARSAVEVLQPFGFASRAPAGGLVIVLAVGGDQGDLVALPVAAPGARLGGLKEGEAAIYGADGSRVIVRTGGVVEVQAASAVRLTTPTAELHLDADGLRARLGDDVGIDCTPERLRVRRGTARVSLSAAAAKLAVGGAFVAATAGGLVCSGPITLGADPDPEG